MYLISESPEPAPDMEIDAILFLAEDADREFGVGHPIGVCVACRRADCKRPHRKYTMDGYAKWQLEVAGVERGEEAVLRSKEEFRKWAGVPMQSGGTRGGGGEGGMPGAGPRPSTGPGGYPGAGPGPGPRPSTGPRGYPGAGPGPEPGPTPQGKEDFYGNYDHGNEDFADYVRIIKDRWVRETAGKSPREVEELRKKYKTIWREDTGERGVNIKMPWDEEPRPPPPRPDPGRGYGSVPKQGPGNPSGGGGGPGPQRRQSYNGPPPPRNDSTGGPPRGGYDSVDGLTFEQSKGIYKSQWEKYTRGQDLKTCRLWKTTLKDAWENAHGSRAKGVSMPWDDIPDESESRRGTSKERPDAGRYDQGRSRGYYPPRTGSPRRDRDRDRDRRNSTSGDSRRPYIELTDDYEDTRAHFEEMWERKSIGKDREGLRELRGVMEVAWEQRTGEMGRHESMPWHSNYKRRRSTYSRGQSQSPRAKAAHRDEIYREQKRQFEKQWFEISRGKDSTKRYTLAHMIHATFIGVVGDRGNNEEMPWSKDYRSSPPPPSAPRKPSPVRQASRVRESRRDSSPSRLRKTEPPPAWIGSRDYEKRRKDLNTTFITRIDGKSREEMQKIAMSFREVWVKDAGVRANDHRMAWDDILSQRRNTRRDSRDDSDVLSERYGRMGFDDTRERGRERERSRERGRSGRKESKNGHRTRKNSSCSHQ